MRDIAALEADISESVYDAVQEWIGRTDRSRQTAIGMSALGHCSEYVRRTLMKQEPEQPTDKLAAFLGTWIGAGVEEVLRSKWRDVILQSEVSLDLDTEQGSFTITGHPDVIRPDKRILLDLKSVDGLDVAERYGFTDKQKRFQRHGYGYAAWLNGTFGDCEVEDVLVGNLWIDRSGREHRFHTRLEPLSLDVIEEMKHWLSEVVYAYLHEQEAPKEPSYEFCVRWCEFAPSCRAGDGGRDGLITDEKVKAAVDLYLEGAAMEREGKRLKNSVKGEIEGYSGSTGNATIRTTHVNETFVPGFTRRAYDKVEVRKIKGAS